MLNHTFTFNGHSSDEFGIKIERFRAFNRSARKYDYASVPGRNGNIYNLQQAWEEISVSYQIWAKEYQYNIADVSQNAWYFTGNGKNGYIINGTASSSQRAQLAILSKTYDYDAALTIKSVGDAQNVSIEWYIAEAHDTLTPIDSGTVTASDQVIDVPAGTYVSVLIQLTVGATYDNVFVRTEIEERYQLASTWTKIMEWLNSADGYARLEDTYDTSHYYQAVFVEATDIENFWNRTGRAVITFRCRPERFLADSAAIELTTDTQIGRAYSETPIYATTSTSTEPIGHMSLYEYAEILRHTGIFYEIRTYNNVVGYVTGDSSTGLSGFWPVGYGCLIRNNTGRLARPLVTMKNCSSAARFQINNLIMTISASFDEILVDCETEYITGTPEANYNLSTSVFTDEQAGGLNVIYDFPYLKPGNNCILFSGADMTMETRIWEI